MQCFFSYVYFYEWYSLNECMGGSKNKISTLIHKTSGKIMKFDFVGLFIYGT